ncbi:hypothetical protein ROA7450_03322 [Roseovarius albus]|uniref:Glycosyltransferase 61 catalytic domain-containing protein n=2 Tax=Roseovarius albus TaxID=1247867 RepID=A0A1X6ZWD9_9RHOB|nr:hypothetical protein ROA7450_03322 [Roseovarius albus]
MPSATLISAQSFLVDRIVPDCEVIHLPSADVPGGILKYRIAVSAFRSQERPRRLKFVPAQNITAPDGSIIFDFRHHSPGNWAHLLTMHLPLLFHISEQLAIPWQQALILMPKSAPRYARRALAMFGLKTLFTDDIVHGAGVEIIADPWQCFWPVRPDWATTHSVLSALHAAIAREDRQLPRRILLLRRDTRTLTNSADIVALTEPLGFEVVYPEDYTPAEQAAFFMNAEAIIAVHGAGLAPLLYRTKNSAHMKLVELFPCGHITSVFRFIATQTNTAWVGVRGKLRPEYVKPAYRLSKPYRRFSLDNFEVDPRSLMLALRKLEIAA